MTDAFHLHHSKIFWSACLILVVGVQGPFRLEGDLRIHTEVFAAHVPPAAPGFTAPESTPESRE